MPRIAVFIMAALPWLSPLANAASWPLCDVRPDGPAIIVNGDTHAPLFFIGNNQFGKDGVLLDEVRLAANAGLKLFGFTLKLDWHMSAEDAAATVAKFHAANPDGYFYVRIWLGPSRAWLDENPDECITKSGGSRLGLASPSSELWREAAAAKLRARIEEIIHGPYAAHFLGAGLGYLNTAEWFYPDTNDFMDYSPANLAAFRAWLKGEYRSDKRLRKAWNDPDAALKTAAFPSPEFRDAAAWGPFRDPLEHRPAIDMQRFQSDLMADTIAYFASIVKETTEGRSLAGAFYGYTMELNNNGPRALAHSGHLSLARLLQCSDIDIIQAPYSYFERAVGQPGHLHLPVDSIALHGKLAIIEEDTFTHLSEEPAQGLMAPGWRSRTKDFTETMSVARRNFGNALGRQCGLWFFDLLSDGRWKQKAFWDSAPLLRRMAAEMRSEPPFQPEVAFLASEKAPHLLRATTRPLLFHSLSTWRSELDRIGTPVGYYLQSDLPKLPDSVKVIILPNAFDLTKRECRAIKARQEKGATVIWTYAPGIVGP